MLSHHPTLLRHLASNLGTWWHESGAKVLFFQRIRLHNRLWHAGCNCMTRNTRATTIVAQRKSHTKIEEISPVYILNTLKFLSIAGALTVGFSGCDVDIKDEGKLPNVDVDVDDGRLPDVDVRGPDVEVKTDTVEVPVPDVDIDLPKENENE